jgi:Cd2+/Zn2+-exporting ATPase
MTETREKDGGVATVELTVPEMDCPSCVGKVENRLGGLKGVSDYDLHPTRGTAEVRYNPGTVTEDEVVASVEGAGYEVVRDESDAVSPPSEVWKSRRGLLTWLGAFFLTAGLAVEFVVTGVNVPVASLAFLELTVAGALLLASVAATGLPVVKTGYYSAKSLSLDIDLLMGVAILAATGVGLYVEAATLAVLFSIAELLEQYSMDRTRDSLRELVELSPEEATVRRDGAEETVPVSELRVGDTVVVRPGEKIPADGVVVQGGSAVDESPITGESVPVDKDEGDEVYAGTFNESGYIELEVDTDPSDTTLARIIELVQAAGSKQTEKEKFVDSFAGYYTPIVVALAVLTAAVPPLALGWDALTWFVRGLTLLVIACPCAFVISTPVTVASGVTSAAKNGVLIKGGNHLEAMGGVDAVAFDKTGTLTKGALTVTDTVLADGATEEDLLRHAAAVEERSEHPIGEAVVEAADDTGVSFPDASDFENLAGKGVRATVEGTVYYAGKPALFEDMGFEFGEPATDGGERATVEDQSVGIGKAVDEIQAQGKTVVVVGTDERLLGVLGVADEVRPEARVAVDNLHRMGVEPLVMLTGDNEGTARAVADELGVDGYRSELLPEEKVDAVEELEAEYGDVAMVGDGVNDAPALAAATVGVAMGAAGTDTAIETSDIALMGDDITKLPYLYGLAREANNVIRQNIWSSLAVKALLAVGVPFGYITVAVAVVVGDMGMSLGVTGNAMRLSRMVPDSFLRQTN